jgi:hypothetical protein
MFVPADVVPSAFVGLGAILSSKGVTPFSRCSEHHCKIQVRFP